MKHSLGAAAVAVVIVSGCGGGASEPDAASSWQEVQSGLPGIPVTVGNEVVVVSGGLDRRMKARALTGGSTQFKPLAGMPLPWRCCFTATATEREVLVWGGSGGITGPQGASYSVEDRSWRVLPPAPTRTPSGHTAVWTGEEMVAWGGELGGSCSGPTARRPTSFDPAADRWRRGPRSPSPGRIGHTAAWDGRRLLIWGGSTARSGSCEVTDSKDNGLTYSPRSGDWGRIAPAPIQWLEDSNAVWTGNELLVWNGGALALYDPTSRRWRQAPAPPLEGLEVFAGAPRLARVDEAFAWSGEELIIWGGRSSRDSVFEPYADGAAFDPRANEWRPLPAGPGSVTGPASSARVGGWLYVVGLEGAARLRLP